LVRLSISVVHGPAAAEASPSIQTAVVTITNAFVFFIALLLAG
jgi:hypothetical protein